MREIAASQNFAPQWRLRARCRCCRRCWSKASLACLKMSREVVDELGRGLRAPSYPLPDLVNIHVPEYVLENVVGFFASRLHRTQIVWTDAWANALAATHLA